ncbi:glycosyltransferase involved in cell wall biosynthesis [Nocardioides perillae]|uniref:Glycosyltransferase involved in cell wall biosynthesis n=1 Tax=Nocardioides perillae TaxID=1119534 RepID=A0A7Y9RSS9_9ACTN|nr:glycosyltransferase involved in cell wall biosynthesis [Nocardioides perillae]
MLTGIPNYPSGAVHDGYAPWSRRRETLDGIEVIRSPLYPSHDASALRRLLNYGSWAISSSVFGQRVLRETDVALVYSSPATAALPAMVARTLWRTPYVLLVQDVWPDSIFASGFLSGRWGRQAHNLIDVFVRRAYARAAHIVVTSPGMADLLARRGVPQNKLTIIYNWLPEDRSAQPADHDADLKRALGVPADSLLFMYAGNHGKAQALDALIDAFTSDETRPAHLVLMGDGVEKARLIDRARASARIHFLDPVPRAEADRLMVSADVSVVSLADEPLFAVTMPSKVQSGLASGRPLLVIARGDAADVVTGSGAGVAAAPSDPVAIAEAVAKLSATSLHELTLMGRRGLEVYRSQMARDVGAKRMRAVLRDAARRSRTAIAGPPDRTAEGSVSEQR